MINTNTYKLSRLSETQDIYHNWFIYWHINLGCDDSGQILKSKVCSSHQQQNTIY